MNQSVLTELKKAKTRDELVLCWKYFALAASMSSEYDWSGAKEAFKKRASELGIELKG